MNPYLDYVWLLIILNVALIIFKRIQLTFKKKNKIDTVPEAFKKEVNSHLNDGYKLTSVSPNKVILIKTKPYFFAWFLFPFFPNLSICSTFLSNVFAIELTLTNNKVELLTF